MSHSSSPNGDISEQLAQAEQLKVSGSNEEALSLLEKLLIEEPSNALIFEEIADNELSLEHYSRAEAAASRAIYLNPKSYTAHYILGFIYSHEGSFDKALASLRESNKLQPNNAEILRCLGWALFRTGDQLQGLVTLERSLNLDPDNTLTLCDLGVVYLELQNFNKARSLFLRTLDLDPGNTRAKECIDAAERFEKEMKSAVKSKTS